MNGPTEAQPSASGLYGLYEKLYLTSPPLPNRKNDSYELLNQPPRFDKASKSPEKPTPLQRRRPPLTEISVKGKGSPKKETHIDPTTGDTHQFWTDPKGQQFGKKIFKSSGDVLVYRMVNEVRMGPATYTMKNNTVVNFVFVNGIRKGSATEKAEKYLLEFTYSSKGKRNGQATKTSEDEKQIKHIVVFNYVNDIKSGSATEIYTDCHGTVHEISFSYLKNKRQGEAIHVMRNLNGELSKSTFNYVDGISDEKALKLTSVTEESGPEIPPTPAEESNEKITIVEEDNDLLNDSGELINLDLSTEEAQPVQLEKEIEKESPSPKTPITPNSPTDSTPTTPTKKLTFDSPTDSKISTTPAIASVITEKTASRDLPEVLEPLKIYSDVAQLPIPKPMQALEYQFPMVLDGVHHLMTRYQHPETHKVTGIVHSILESNVPQGPAIEDHGDGTYTAFNFEKGMRQGTAFKYANNKLTAFEYVNNEKAKYTFPWKTPLIKVHDQLIFTCIMPSIAKNTLIHGQEESVLYDSAAMPNQTRIGVKFSNTGKSPYLIFSERINADLTSEIVGLCVKINLIKENVLSINFTNFHNGQLSGPSLSFYTGETGCIEKSWRSNGLREGEAAQIRDGWTSFVHYSADSVQGKCVVSLPKNTRIEYSYVNNVKQGDATKFFSNGSKLHYQYNDNQVVAPGKFVDSQKKSANLNMEQIDRIFNLANPILADAVQLNPIAEEGSGLINSNYFS